METSNKSLVTVGLIGSFKSHYDRVLSALKALREVGLQVLTPLGSAILNEGIDFVRFETDSACIDDPTVQTITLHRLFLADFVYVVAPHGYVGRTTCYEIGRLIQARKPIYFSAPPLDLPISLPPSHILTVQQLTAKIVDNEFAPCWPFDNPCLGPLGQMEKEVARGKPRVI